MGITNTVLSRLVSLLSPAGRSARLLIMIYHRVLAERDPLLPGEVDADGFDWQMRLMARYFNVLPLSEGSRLLQAGHLPAQAACITFDDGYADNLHVAVPILRRYGLPATFFIATGFLDGGRMWNDSIIEWARRAPGAQWDLSEWGLGTWRIGTMEERQRAAMALVYQLRHLDFDERNAKVEALVSGSFAEHQEGLMLTADELRALMRAGMELGAHTVNHPILTRLDDDRARREISDSKEVLERVTGRSVTLFAFPNGTPGKDYDDRHVAMVKDAGFEAAVSTRRAVARRGSDVFQLPRFTPWHSNPARFHEALARSYFW